MANANKPFGLRPVTSRGSEWDGQATMYCIPSTDNNAFAIGDPVTLAGGADANGVQTVTIATAGYGNLVLGPIVGTRGTKYGGSLVDPSSLDTTVIPATKTKDYYVLVADDPHLVFEMQESATTDAAALAAGSAGSNIDLVAGANNGYVSAWKIDSTSANTGATRQLQLLGLAPRPDNAFGAYAKWYVRIVYHQFNAGVAGV